MWYLEVALKRKGLEDMPKTSLVCEPLHYFPSFFRTRAIYPQETQRVSILFVNFYHQEGLLYVSRQGYLKTAEPHHNAY